VFRERGILPERGRPTPSFSHVFRQWPWKPADRAIKRHRSGTDTLADGGSGQLSFPGDKSSQHQRSDECHLDQFGLGFAAHFVDRALRIESRRLQYCLHNLRSRQLPSQRELHAVGRFLTFWSQSAQRIRSRR
jgi:hypothetical protein